MERRGTVESAIAQIGLSRGTLFNWFKRDEPPPGPEKVKKLRAWLGEEAEYILNGPSKKGAETAEALTPYRIEGKPRLESGPTAGHNKRVLSNLPSETKVDREQLHAQLDRLLDSAEELPGMFGHLQVLLTVEERTVEKLRR